MTTTQLAQESAEGIFERVFGVFLGIGGAIIALLYVLLFLCALVSVLRNQRLTGGGKLLWVAVAFAYPLLGSLGWFLFGKQARLVRSDVPV
ncbi:sorbitol-specific phosphotransferase system component IIC [Crossiella equi]|uniref:Sorbitol-specific phosphotransferase system component IIC n=1 Tax=Crossiella equi TaxID=130796 RepID=A0ABS5A940_9PSEU|nr:PLDc N-terminal domain-containing protein [Crossiella equi]MBP2473092.1 sorbitol-specific phosphotransferase system component IIC [Crossiella equi]